MKKVLIAFVVIISMTQRRLLKALTQQTRLENTRFFVLIEFSPYFCIREDKLHLSNLKRALIHSVCTVIASPKGKNEL